jgi:hypothetical protein
MPQEDVVNKILEGLQSSSWTERGQAARLLQGTVDPQTLLSVLVGSSSLLGAHKRLVVEALLPKIAKAQPNFSAFALFHILTEILPDLRDDQMEWHVINTLFQNKKLTIGLRARVLSESLRRLHVPHQKQRRLTRRVLVALGSCPTTEARELATALLPQSEDEFKQRLVLFLCSFKQELGNLLYYLNHLPLDHDAKSIILSHLIGFESRFSLLKLRFLERSYHQIQDKKLFVNQLLSAPKTNTGSLALRLFTQENDDVIRGRLAFAIGLERRSANLKRWWSLSYRETSFRAAIAMRSKVLQNICQLKQSSSRAVSILNDDQYTMSRAAQRKPDPFQLTNLSWDLARLLANVDADKLIHIIETLRPAWPSHAIGSMDQQLIRSCGSRPGVTLLFFQSVAACKAILEFRDVALKLIRKMRIDDYRRNWIEWGNVLDVWLGQLNGVDARDALIQQLHKVLLVCFEHGLSTLSTTDQNVSSKRPIDSIIQLSVRLRKAVDVSVFGAYLEQVRHVPVAAAYLSQRSAEELLVVLADDRIAEQDLLMDALYHSVQLGHQGANL